MKSTPRDVFMYLLATIMLYFSVYGSISLLFGYINAVFPDPLNPYYSAADAVRWPLALFIIIFPVYFLVVWFLNRDIAHEHKKSEIKIRKWLVYLTLFLAALLIIGDLVTLIYTFLNGEITARFLLKVVAMFVVAGGVFSYYFYDLRKEPGAFSRSAKAALWVVGAVYVAIVVIGVVVAGSPLHQRQVRFDQQRTNDLQNIQGEILNYWTQTGKLPNSLAGLNDPISGFIAPRDPETGNGYIYAVTATTSFELCATFDLPLSANQMNMDVAVPQAPVPSAGYTNSNWDHGQGYQCFSRTIDTRLYPPKVPAK